MLKIILNRVATKLGNSGKIRKFYFQSETIRDKRKVLQNIRENQGSFQFLIVSFTAVAFSIGEKE